MWAIWWMIFYFVMFSRWFRNTIRTVWIRITCFGWFSIITLVQVICTVYTHTRINLFIWCSRRWWWLLGICILRWQLFRLLLIRLGVGTNAGPLMLKKFFSGRVICGCWTNCNRSIKYIIAWKQNRFINSHTAYIICIKLNAKIDLTTHLNQHLEH